MKTYRFTLVLNAIEIADAIEEKIYSTCNDALLASSGGKVTLDFDREAESREEAVRSAIYDVRRAGYDILTIEEEDNIRTEERVDIARYVWNAYQVELEERQDVAEALALVWEGITAGLSEEDVDRSQEDGAKCPDCNRRVATPWDEAIHNTGECGCKSSRTLCWRKWNGDKCCERSPYDKQE